MQKLTDWQRSEHRKPLIIQGVRQVGKTWLMRQFAQEHFEGHCHYLNFDMSPELGELFESSRNPDRILESLAYRSKRPVASGDLLIFDEAQACPAVLHSLKYFCELRPDLFVLLAGSLLGLQLARPESYPVGKVSFMKLEPMSFSEFVLAQGETGLLECMENWPLDEKLPQIFFTPLSQKFKHYQIVGGMPEVAQAWCERQDLQAAQELQKNIMQAYRQDVFSHAKSLDAPKIQRIWQSLPKQLSREYNRFRYSLVEPRSNARKYGDALQWLIDAKMVRAVHRAQTARVPLSSYEDPSAFKIYFVDTGLFASLAGIEPEVIEQNNALFVEVKGALAENAVLQSLSQQFDAPLHYWAMSKPQAEVDFVVEHHGHVIPIEVKAGTNVRSPSMNMYMQQYGQHTPLRVSLSQLNLSLDGNLLNIPLFMVDQTRRLIDAALAQLG